MNISRLITDNLAQGKTSAETKEAVEAELTDLAISAKGWEVKANHRCYDGNHSLD